MKNNKILSYNSKHHFLSGRSKIHFFTKNKKKKDNQIKDNDEFEKLV
jgi:hypothetical protein